MEDDCEGRGEAGEDREGHQEPARNNFGPELDVGHGRGEAGEDREGHQDPARNNFSPELTVGDGRGEAGEDREGHPEVARNHFSPEDDEKSDYTTEVGHNHTDYLFLL